MNYTDKLLLDLGGNWQILESNIRISKNTTVTINGELDILPKGFQRIVKLVRSFGIISTVMQYSFFIPDGGNVNIEECRMNAIEIILRSLKEKSDSLYSKWQSSEYSTLND